MGNPDVDTPNLDRLADAGTLFRRAYSNNPVCGPFRGSLLTGQYTSRCGVERNGDPLPKGVPTFAEAFHDGGGQTAFVGKWHLGGTGNGPIPRELRGGFQRFLGYQCYNGFYEDVCFYDDENREHRFDRHRTEVTTDLAIRQLETLSASDRPFFLMISYQAPHYPVQPAPEYAAAYRDRRITRRPNVSEGIDPFTPTFSPPSPRPFDRDPDYRRYGNDLDEYIRLYNAMCTQIDANVGRLLDALERLGRAGDTAVVFTSDHGDMQGSHGLKNKCHPYEESAGIPLIVRVPGTPAGQVCEVPVSGVDLMPTCLELAGQPAVESVDGKSFVALVRADSEPCERTVFAEHGSWCMIVRGGWKLVADREAGSPAPTMLFHLEEDPYEMRNLRDDPSATDARNTLLADLMEWHETVRGSARSR